VAERHPRERYEGETVTPELLRSEAARFDDTPAGGAASWALGEASALLRLAAAALATRPQPLFEGNPVEYLSYVPPEGVATHTRVVVYPAGSATPTPEPERCWVCKLPWPCPTARANGVHMSGDPESAAQENVAGSATPTDAYGCPDGGTCHHDCLAESVAVCWRTLNAAPLSAWSDRWPREGGMAPVLVAGSATPTGDDDATT
jgi:hypothetical protein